jgi:hypothetical protein
MCCAKAWQAVETAADMQRTFGARMLMAASTSAVMPGALPAEWRFALVAAHPTSPLFYRVSL